MGTGEVIGDRLKSVKLNRLSVLKIYKNLSLSTGFSWFCRSTPDLQANLPPSPGLIVLPHLSYKISRKLKPPPEFAFH